MSSHHYNAVIASYLRIDTFVYACFSLGIVVSKGANPY